MDSWNTALLVIAVIGFLNALVRPMLIFFKLPPTLLTFGLATLLGNGLMMWLAGEFIPGFAVSGVWPVLLVALGMAATSVSFSDLLAIDDDDSYYHHVVRHIVDLYGRPEKTETPGIVFLEIDGLSEPVLRRAIRDGRMPTLARWLETVSHKLVQWECDLSSQTSASQAGILLGDNFDIPAFRWYEKDRGKQMVSNHPYDVIALEQRLSTRNGASRGNLFSGDAPQTMFTASTLGNFSRHRTQDFYPLFMGVYNFLRLVALFLWDVVLELRAARFQRRHDVRPRVHRGGIYPLLRASTTILLREMNLYVLIGDMYAGLPSVYASFVGYDEVAHHSGVERPDAVDILHKLDKQFERLESAARMAPRPYHFVLLSDHGQSQGATFKQRYGMTLEEVVRELVSEEHTVKSIESEDAGWGNLSVFFTDILNDIIPGDNHLVSRILRRWLKNRIYFDQVALGPYRKYLERLGVSAGEERAQVVVLASGNLGLIYLTDWKERLSYEQINEAFPDVIPGLTQHEGISFVLVRSKKDGPLAIGADGVHFLADGRVEGEDPLVKFGPNAAAHLRRTDSFPHVADIMVNSLYDPETGEVAAFEELVGSHGGLGGDQSSSFLMFPAAWQLETASIVGACAVHAQLKCWLDQHSAQEAFR
jgi:uncharacterized membrane protein YvlD (DUF360 family)